MISSSLKKKDVIAICIFIFCILCINLSYEFYKYLNLKNTININAKVLLQYQKNNYYVLKLKTKKGEIFYTTSRDDLTDIKNRNISIYGALGKGCGFLEYLKSCFIISYDIRLKPRAESKLRDKFTSYLDSAHTPLLASFYKTLFFAYPLDKDIRDFASIFGISHLFAISGFHLGVLISVLYFVMKPIYRILQNKFFTYRNMFFDLNVIILFFAFNYLIILDFTPSFLRAFIMFMVGSIMLYSGIRILSFQFLFLCAFLAIALFPRVLFSIGFFLSVCGVFYIYLFLKHIKIKNRFIYFSLLNVVVFLNMLLISHYFFPTFSIYQLLSPFLSMLFIVLYPLVLILHFLGLGMLLDNPLYFLFSLNFVAMELFTSTFLFVAYLGLSLLSIFNKLIYYFIILVSILFLIYGLLKGFI